MSTSPSSNIRDNHDRGSVADARSRRQIQDHYASSLAEIGAFPIRKRPLKLEYKLDLKDRFLSSDSIAKRLFAGEFPAA